MTELSYVISSTLIDDECPRELLGKLCMADDDYTCLCEQVVASHLDIVRNAKGIATAVTLTMTLEQGGDPLEVENGIKMSGFVARFGGTDKVVEAVFLLNRTENVELKALTL